MQAINSGLSSSMKRKFVLINLLLGLSMVACSVSESAGTKPPINFPSAYLNQQIELLVIPQWNTFKTTDSVGLKLLYKSENQITLPRNYNLRLFVQQTGGWIEIKEMPTERYPSGDIILSLTMIPSSDDIVTFIPMLPDVTKRYELGVYVFGDMATTDGIKKVGAYVTVVLNP